MPSLPENETITIEGILKDLDIYPILDQFNFLFSTLKRKLFVDIFHRNRELNQVKKDYIASYNISARHFNSLFYQLKSQINSLIELRKTQKNLRESKVKSLNSFLKESKQKIEQLKLDRQKIIFYQQKVRRYKKERRNKT